ncbi:transposase domain-containing protein [Rhodococcus sp. NPDC060090]|uniref:transposase domain-containing protein n=1 Tax=Rhodococcus sp. NPDC060090 TaxID=3347056 RepID=UPI003650C2E7
MDTQSVIPPARTVAAGRFAPGHLGELTQLVPFEMVDEALTATGTVQARIRELPSRVVVYLLLAAALFEDLGYRQVWARLTSGLTGLPVANPGSSALAQARRRIGPAPLRALFELLAGPPAAPLRWHGLLVCAIDGTTMSVPDSAANLTRYRRQTGSHGGSGYPCCACWRSSPAVLAPCSARCSDPPTSAKPATHQDCSDVCARA